MSYKHFSDIVDQHLRAKAPRNAEDLLTVIEAAVTDMEKVAMPEVASLSHIPMLHCLNDIKFLSDEWYELNARLKRLLDAMRGVHVPEAFERDDVKTVTLENHRYTVSGRVFCSIRADAKSQGKAWLIKNGYEDVIKETVNSSSLAALARGYLEEGQELPEEIFNVHTKPSVSITKVAKRGKSDG